MSFDGLNRLKAVSLPAIVVLMVCGVVAWAARSPVDWRKIPSTSSAAVSISTTPASAPADIEETVASCDRIFAASWKAAGVQPAPLADERIVLRRLLLALCGTIPSLEEIREFESNATSDRLDRWTSRLLADERFCNYFAERLARSFVGSEVGQFIVFRRDRFVDWLRRQLAQNTPYDQIVRQMVSEKGLWTDHPATNYVTAAIADGTLDENKLAGRTVRAFLGQRIDCAQCHDHPFAAWKQSQFQGVASLFGQVQSSLVGVEDRAARVYEVEDRKTLKKHAVEPAVPFHPEWLPNTGTRRERLAGWITHPENRRFERAIVNRVWGLLFGKPYHSPVDDLPDPAGDRKAISASASAAEAPRLTGPQFDVLDVIGADFRAHHCDLKRMIRVIAALRPFRIDSLEESDSPNSRSIPRSAVPVLKDESTAEPGEGSTSWTTADSPTNWSVFPMTRLRPEQLIGSILQAASVRTIDQNSHLLVRMQRCFQEAEFVKEYGDLGDAELEERAGTISQALLRMNGKFAGEAVKSGPLNSTGRIAIFAGTDSGCLDACYLVALSRRPTAAESEYFLAQLASTDGKSRSAAVEDIFWSLFNSPEFSWNH